MNDVRAPRTTLKSKTRNCYAAKNQCFLDLVSEGIKSLRHVFHAPKGHPNVYCFVSMCLKTKTFNPRKFSLESARDELIFFIFLLFM